MTHKSNVDILREANDPLTGALTTIDGIHRHLHDGEAFIYSGAATLSDAAAQDILLVVPAGIYPHIFFTVRGSGETNAVLYEAATVSANGTGVAEINRNRNSTNVASLAVYTGPTVTGTGTVLMTVHFGSGQQLGGEDRAEQEFLLKPSTIYLFRITSEANGNDLSWQIGWYEGDTI